MCFQNLMQESAEDKQKREVCVDLALKVLQDVAQLEFYSEIISAASDIEDLKPDQSIAVYRTIIAKGAQHLFRRLIFSFGSAWRADKDKRKCNLQAGLCTCCTALGSVCAPWSAVC